MRDLAQETLLKELVAMKPTLQRKGILHATLFGSRARGDNRSDSDIDLLVEIDENRKFSLLDLIGVAHHIEDSIGPRADLFTPGSLEQQFLERVRRDQIVLF